MFSLLDFNYKYTIFVHYWKRSNLFVQDLKKLLFWHVSQWVQIDYILTDSVDILCYTMLKCPKQWSKLTEKSRKCGLFQSFSVVSCDGHVCIILLPFLTVCSKWIRHNGPVWKNHWACKNKLFGCCVVTCQCMIKTSENITEQIYMSFWF